jgi:hypothetical protein
MDRFTDTFAFLALAVGITIALPVHATTEAEAVDELIAVLGTTLPCSRYALAWLDDAAARIEYCCLASPAQTGLPTEQRQAQRVYYNVDMRVARSRFAQVYGLRGTPTPAAVLAQFLQRLAALPESGGSEGPHLSPLVVYSRSVTSLAASPVTVQQRSNTQKAMVFSP